MKSFYFLISFVLIVNLFPKKINGLILKKNTFLKNNNLLLKYVHTPTKLQATEADSNGEVIRQVKVLLISYIMCQK